MSLAYIESRVRCEECRTSVDEYVAMTCRDCRIDLCEACHGEHSCPSEQEHYRQLGRLDDAAGCLKEAIAKETLARDCTESAAEELRKVGTAECDALAEQLDELAWQAATLRSAAATVEKLRGEL